MGRPVPPLLPWPADMDLRAGAFTLSRGTPIIVGGGQQLMHAALVLAGFVEEQCGLRLVVRGGPPTPNSILLVLDSALSPLSQEGYSLDVREDGIELAAAEPDGLLWGIQTLRQLLPQALVHGAGEIPALKIRDKPRFAWRGFMLDVARHFFPVEDLRRIIQHIARYKLNRLHLHLTDDQGWRIEIQSWPDLARMGGRSSVGGDPGGFYTQAQYEGIVRYAAEQGIVIVPEIDLPGHTHAALAAYPSLSFDERQRTPYTGTDVGFSSLGIGKPITARFVTEVLEEVAAITPGGFLHVGGDEAHSTAEGDYRRFIAGLAGTVRALGKTMVGWQEISACRDLPDEVIVQYWDFRAPFSVESGRNVILSPANRAYLDMKYRPEFPLGLEWAGYVSPEDSYQWEPAESFPGLGESQILGIEAALWTETLRTRAQLEQMMFPRLACIAEKAWSPRGMASAQGFWARIDAQRKVWDNEAIRHYVES